VEKVSVSNNTLKLKNKKELSLYELWDIKKVSKNANEGTENGLPSSDDEEEISNQESSEKILSSVNESIK
jgi:hypothetical protein